jgi:hypothetical protein
VYFIQKLMTDFNRCDWVGHPHLMELYLQAVLTANTISYVLQKSVLFTNKKCKYFESDEFIDLLKQEGGELGEMILIMFCCVFLLAVDMRCPDAPPTWGPGWSILPAVDPVWISLPPAADLPRLVSSLEHGMPVRERYTVAFYSDVY